METAATVYILKCADGSYYTGITRKPVEARVWEHNNKVVDSYTSVRTPVVLVLAEPYVRIVDAVARERQIKGWSRRKKEALIAGKHLALPDLARRPSRGER